LIIEEVEHFCLNQLTDFSEKNQLYYWLGLVVYKKQHDLVKALKYFEDFEKKAKKSQESLLIRSRDYLRIIKEEMKIKEK
jgi:hypothetical protein